MTRQDKLKLFGEFVIEHGIEVSFRQVEQHEPRYPVFQSESMDDGRPKASIRLNHLQAHGWPRHSATVCPKEGSFIDITAEDPYNARNRDFLWLSIVWEIPDLPGGDDYAYMIRPRPVVKDYLGMREELKALFIDWALDPTLALTHFSHKGRPIPLPGSPRRETKQLSGVEEAVLMIDSGVDLI